VGGIGYGPGSLSAAISGLTWKLIGTSGWLWGTTPYGMPKSPYWPEPKSGHRVIELSEPM
jgi:hypothetical protein